MNDKTQTDNELEVALRQDPINEAELARYLLVHAEVDKNLTHKVVDHLIRQNDRLLGMFLNGKDE